MKDNVKKGEVFGVDFKKLHGHTKIILTDIKTGEQEIHEKDNLVTLAVPNIYEENLGGTIDYKKLVRLRDMFGGVMCFTDELAETDLMPPSEGVNALIAHAGQTAHETTNPKRGNPNGQGTTDPTAGGTSVTFQWDFASNQGNGTISSLALCHKEGGDIGLTPTAIISGEYLVHSLNNSQIVLASGNRAARGDFDDFLHGMICYDEENDIGYHLNSSGMLKKIQYFYKKTALQYEITDTVVLETNQTGLNGNYIFYDDGFIYSLAVTAASAVSSTVAMTKLNLSTMTETTATFTIDGQLYQPWTTASPTQIFMASRINAIVKSGDVVYLPNSGLTNFYKLNLTTGASSLLASHLPTGYQVKVFHDTSNTHGGYGANGQMNISDGLIVGHNYIINHDAVYATSVSPTTITSNDALQNHATRYVPLMKKPAFIEWVYTFGSGASASATIYLSVAHPTIYLGTIQNLESSVTKTSDRNMTIIYTLSEVSE